MANFFFLSFNEDDLIEHAKISIKFDNNNEGKARISFRITSRFPKKEDDQGIYLLIKNDEDPVRLDEIVAEYNTYLDAEQFRQVAGAYGLKLKIKKDHCTIFRMGDFLENPDIKGKGVIHPTNIRCEQVEYKNIPKKLKNRITKRDILLKISTKDVTKVNKEIEELQENEKEIEELQENGKEISLSRRDLFWIFQFRIFLRNFVPSDTLDSWKLSNKSWSVDFDIHKHRDYEDLIEYLEEESSLKYPRSVELWFTIPHSHHFEASSPVYEKAFRLKKKDLKYKTKDVDDKEKKPREIGEFRTLEGDYAVMIMNRLESFVEFSIICVSPFLPGEKPEDLREKIEEFRSKESNFVTWDRILTPLTLLITLLSLILGSTVALVTSMGGCCERISTEFGAVDLKLLILSAVFTGATIWAIAASLSFASQHVFSKKSYSRRDELDIGSREVGAAVTGVILILYGAIISLLYFNQQQIYLGPREFEIVLITVVIIFSSILLLLFYYKNKLIDILERKFGMILIIVIIILCSLLYLGLR